MRNKPTILGALGSLFTVFLMYHILKLSIIKPYTHYLDSTEITNYTLLESLLLPKGAADNTTTPTSMAEDNIHLTLDELKHLSALHQPSIKPTTTIIIQYESIETLSLQLGSISNQKNFNPPNTIHIVCQTKVDQSLIQDSITGKKNIVLSITDNQENWYQHIDKINSEYVILINKGVIPGQGYFNFVLGLLNTPQFGRALIGTEQDNTNICQQDEAYYVHAVKDISVLRREWYLQQDKYDLSFIILPTSLLDHELHGNTKTSCVNVSSGGLVFFKEESKQNHVLDELICQFGEKQQQRDVIHLVTMGSEEEFELPSCDSNGEIVIIHHPAINAEEANRTINKLSPRVVIYEKSETKESVVDDMIGQKEETTFIGLPTKDIHFISSWITDVSIDTLQQWYKPKINLVVTGGGKRSQQLRQLFHSIKGAHYLGDQVDLSIVMDEKSDEKSITMVNALEWKQGDKNLRHRISGVHPMQIFTEAWYPSNDDEYAVILDDRIELSSSFYIWLKYNLLKYRYNSNNQQQQTSHLFGISLYSPRIIDTDPSGRQILPKQQTTAYLMQHPSSGTNGGALYFPEHWREYHDYITARLTDQAIIKRGTKLPHLFKDSLLTVAKSNKWISSWRKYFDEMIYMRGYVMLYPTISYSTMVSITNTPITNKKKVELYNQAEKLYKVPLATIVRELPDLELLPLLDIHGQVVHGLDELVKRGHELQRKFSACEPILNHHHDPSDMLCPFSQLIEVPIEQKEIPTKTIALLFTPSTH